MSETTSKAGMIGAIHVLGIALRGGRLPVRGVGRSAGGGGVAQVEQGLQRGAYRRRSEQSAAAPCR